MRRGIGGRRTATGAVLAGVLAAGTLAGCGGGDRPAAAPSPSRPTDAQLQVLVNNLVQCVRQHGAPGMPTIPVRNGHVVMPDENSVDPTTRQNVPAARQACAAVEARIPASVLENGSDQAGPTAADVPKLRTFATCMRANGEPTWPDPKPDGSFPGQDLREGKTPQFRAALQACRRYWDGPMRFTP